MPVGLFACLSLLFSFHTEQIFGPSLDFWVRQCSLHCADCELISVLFVSLLPGCSAARSAACLLRTTSECSLTMRAHSLSLSDGKHHTRTLPVEFETRYPHRAGHCTRYHNGLTVNLLTHSTVAIPVPFMFGVLVPFAIVHRLSSRKFLHRAVVTYLVLGCSQAQEHLWPSFLTSIAGPLTRSSPPPRPSPAPTALTNCPCCCPRQAVLPVPRPPRQQQQQQQQVQCRWAEHQVQ